MSEINHNEIVYRPGTVADSYAIFLLFEESLADLIRRFGQTEATSWSDAEALARTWVERQSLYDYLARSAEHFWVAEQAGEMIGFARSVFHDGVRELTEFFVKPATQSARVGRELLQRAFPAEGARHRLIIATLDMRAQARYLKTGVYPYYPLYYFGREPRLVTVATDLQMVPLAAAPEIFDTLAAIDRAIIGFRRDADHQWLMGDRAGFMLLRQGQPVGYGYTGVRNGPFALLDAQDYPAVLAYAEGVAAANQHSHFGVELPMLNHIAVNYLLEQGFRMDPFTAVFMWDKPLGNPANYICTSPPFFL